MNVYVGVTDWDWYSHVRRQKKGEVNFWKPGGRTFRALSEGDLLLFKLKAAQGGRICGGGFFVGAPITTIDWAWRAFGDENGVSTMVELNDKIWAYKHRPGTFDLNGSVTCIILTDVFYLEESRWLDISAHWSNSIVSGKTFRDDEAVWLVDAVAERLAQGSTGDGQGQLIPFAPGGSVLTASTHRIGQGAFRTLVAGAYQRRCAISGERTVPVLQAAHIRSFAAEGPNSVDNGLFLRSDLHALFDAGYLTVEYNARHELCTVVSGRLHDDFGNGRDYYPYHGRQLAVLPDCKAWRPAERYLAWHHENVFLG